MTGRPSSYKAEFAKQAEKLCNLGATDQEVADFFEVSITTVKNWKAAYPEFLAALKSGKDYADERVERSLFHRAVGYTFDSEKVFQFQGQVIRAPIREHIAPDTTAMIFWLKNRRPDKWRDVHKHEVGGAGAFDNMSDDELKDFIRSEAEALNLGGGPAREGATRGKGKAIPSRRTH